MIKIERKPHSETTLINKYKFLTFKEADGIEWKKDKIEDTLIEQVLSHYSNENVGFVSTMTNGGFYCISIKVHTDEDSDLWSILPQGKRDHDQYIDYRFLFDESIRNKKMWIALESKSGDLLSLGTVSPTEMVDYLYTVI